MTNRMTIKNVMTPNPSSVKSDERISSIITIMKNRNFDHLPVVDDYGKLLGIISKSDLYRKALNLSKETSGATYSEKMLYVSRAKDIMTANPVVVSPDQSVDFAIELLLQDEFHALPVVENEKLIGIITSKDMLEYIIDTKQIEL